jgi:hypothetical protein
MQKFWIFVISFLFTVYEILLVGFAINAANSVTNIWADLPLFQSNTDFMLVLGQVPVLALFAWWYYRKKKAMERDFFRKYSKKDDV